MSGILGATPGSELLRIASAPSDDSNDDETMCEQQQKQSSVDERCGCGSPESSPCGNDVVAVCCGSNRALSSEQISGKARSAQAKRRNNTATTRTVARQCVLLLFPAFGIVVFCRECYSAVGTDKAADSRPYSTEAPAVAPADE